MRRELSCFGPSTKWVGRLEWYAVVPMGVLAVTFGVRSAHAQDATAESPQVMQARIDKLEAEVAELKAIVQQLQSASPKLTTAAVVSSPSALPVVSTPFPESSGSETPLSASVLSQNSQSINVTQTEDRKILDFFHDTTVNLSLDTYYAYNFNHPVGRVNLLRAYDVLSNEFSLSQASVILERAPDLSAGRHWGGRLDLQFGQATDTLQGNPSNEPRPDIYRNIFQAYGTYVAPIGKGVTIDFGKWSSSLGAEGNYTKDQINYSRSFWFNFLPFYHMGLQGVLKKDQNTATVGLVWWWGRKEGSW
jgi:Putative beta-barrel porin-2, OmpL-like. bbp2